MKVKVVTISPSDSVKTSSYQVLVLKINSMLSLPLNKAMILVMVVVVVMVVVAVMVVVVEVVTAAAAAAAAVLTAERL
jgi:hypothetical protein